MKRTLKTTVASLGMFALVALSAAPVAASDFDALGRGRPVIEVEGYKKPVIEVEGWKRPVTASSAPWIASGRQRPVIEVEGYKRPVTTSGAPWIVSGRHKP